MSIEPTKLEYSHIPNNTLANGLISKIKGVKGYAQVTSASWSVSEEESSESEEESSEV